MDRSLTEQQQNVLRLVAEGYTNKMIAKELAISVRSVVDHTSTIRTKLGLTSADRPEFTREARRVLNMR